MPSLPLIFLSLSFLPLLKHLMLFQYILSFHQSQYINVPTCPCLPSFNSLEFFFFFCCLTSNYYLSFASVILLCCQNTRHLLFLYDCLLGFFTTTYCSRHFQPPLPYPTHFLCYNYNIIVSLYASYFSINLCDSTFRKVTQHCN